MEVALLLVSGALAVVLHQVLRYPMGLPGRQGIHWMALLLLARSGSRLRWAGTLSGAGAAATAMLPVWGAVDDPLIWLTFLLPGALVDLAFTRWASWTGSLWFLGVLGGAAHATKPLLRWVVSLGTGLPYDSLLTGLAYPLGTHLLFGIVGGLLGGLAGLGVRASRRRES